MFDTKVCEPSERFAAAVWAGCANIGKTEGEQPCHHINYCSIQSKAAAEYREITYSEQKDKTNVACRHLLSKISRKTTTQQHFGGAISTFK